MTRLFLFAGQSNMVGSGAQSKELPEHVRAHCSKVELFEDGSLRHVLWKETFGPEVGVAEWATQAFPDERVVFCKVARGASNLYYDWNPDGVSRGDEDAYRGPLYPRLVDAYEKLAKETQQSRVDGFFWMQGERDSVFEFMARAYRERLGELVEAVRDLVGWPTLPVVIGQIAPRVYRLEQQRFHDTHRATVQQDQRDLAKQDNHVALAEAADLPQSDNLHFDTGGQLELGRRFAREMAKLLR